MEGSLFFSRKMGKAQKSNGKGDGFYGSKCRNNVLSK